MLSLLPQPLVAALALYGTKCTALGARLRVHCMCMHALCALVMLELMVVSRHVQACLLVTVAVRQIAPMRTCIKTLGGR